ncbi:hypothetical protein NMY22_g15941 [Coprinellus aureogranulatus]|nr:hypothetical protein NMY22_g15941 [Coprinellus aureogranulatus]
MDTSDYTCSACRTAFSTPQLLTRHQRSLCPAASRALSQSHSTAQKRFKLSQASFLRPKWESTTRLWGSATHANRLGGVEGLRRRKVRLFQWCPDLKFTWVKTPQGYAFEREEATEQEDSPTGSGSAVDSSVDVDQENATMPPPTRSPNNVHRRGEPALLEKNRVSPVAHTQHDEHRRVGLSQDQLPEALAPNVYVVTGAEAVRTDTSKISPGWLQGKKNSFHLRRRYYATSFPTHDPDANLDSDAAKTPTEKIDPPLTEPWKPFPNQASFELGEWYIDGGTQASVEGLKKLVALAQRPGFVEDIKAADWTEIFRSLGEGESANAEVTKLEETQGQTGRGKVTDSGDERIEAITSSLPPFLDAHDAKCIAYTITGSTTARLPPFFTEHTADSTAHGSANNAATAPSDQDQGNQHILPDISRGSDDSSEVRGDTARCRLPPFLRPGATKDGIPMGKDNWVDDDGWITSPVKIRVPLLGKVRKRTVGTLYHRSIMSVIRAKLANKSDMQYFHYEPYEVTWQPDPSVPPQRVFSELYSSEAFMKAHQELQDSPHPPDCSRPRGIIGLMFWSDGTHVSSFSSEKLWPCYMSFANESKYRRCKPSLNLLQHIAYFTELSDNFEDYITLQTGGGNLPDKLLPYLKQEAMHAQWSIMLSDAELEDAIVNGFLIIQKSKWFPIYLSQSTAHIATFRCLIATIRQKGNHPCIRCCIHISQLHQMGTPEDLSSRLSSARHDDDARREAVKKSRARLLGAGVGLTTQGVDGPLKDQSLQPVWNAFSSPALTASGFDIFNAMAVDLLHEFEQGIWKDVFLHLMRILDASASGHSLRNMLDRRFRQVPPFGRSIRRFSGNVSETKRTAARDWEDILQCAIPVFEGILPNSDHSVAVVSVITICAEWHALAKLRLHTDSTLQLLQDTTVKLGNELRRFAEGVCQEVKTRESKDEVQARERVAKSRAEAKSGSKPSVGGWGIRRAGANRKDNPDTSNLEGESSSRSSHLDSQALSERSRESDPAGNARSATTNASDGERGELSNEPRGEEISKGKDTVEDHAEGTAGVGVYKAEEAKGKAKAKAKAEGKGKAKATVKAKEKEAVKGKGRAKSKKVAKEKENGKVPTTSTDGGLIPMAGSSESSSGRAESSEGDNSKNGDDEQACKQTKGGAEPGGTSGCQEDENNDIESRRRPVKFSLEKPKFHFLGDYVRTIRMFGTTDNYSTEAGELMHRFSKRWYKQSSKKNPRKEVVRHERKVARIRAIRRELNRRQKEEDASKAKTGDTTAREAEQGATVSKRDVHHYIGRSQNHELPLSSFASTAALVDPLAKTFVPRLRDHLLPRLAAVVRKEAPNLLDKCPFFEQLLDAARISFHKYRIFSHKIMRIYYTSYDVQRGEDIVHLSSSSGPCNVMIVNPEF